MAMERGFWITLSNSAGILDSAFARTEEEARELAIELLSGFPHRDDSDMPRLRVEAGAVCRPAGRASSAEVIRNFSLHSENIKEEAAAGSFDSPLWRSVAQFVGRRKFRTDWDGRRVAAGTAARCGRGACG
jgi:hypothetical protein